MVATIPRRVLAAALPLLIVAGIGYYLAVSTVLADPLRLHFAGLSAEGEDRVLVILTERRESPSVMQRIANTAYFATRQTWVRGLLIRLRKRPRR